MIVLGIDTATPGLSCALVGPDGVLASFEAEEGRRHTELLAPAIEELGRSSGVALSEVDALAVDVGPGLFTGLRVGLATAAALGSALGRPAMGLTSTDILAQPHLGSGHQVVAVVDARRSEVAWARYGEGDGALASPPQLSTPEGLRDTLVALAGRVERLVVVGDGARRYRDLLEVSAPGVVLDIDSPYPSAAVGAALARRRFLAGHAAPESLAPLYLRQADVRIGWASHDLPAGVTTHAPDIRTRPIRAEGTGS